MFFPSGARCATIDRRRGTVRLLRLTRQRISFGSFDSASRDCHCPYPYPYPFYYPYYYSFYYPYPYYDGGYYRFYRPYYYPYRRHWR